VALHVSLLVVLVYRISTKALKGNFF